MGFNYLLRRPFGHDVILSNTSLDWIIVRSKSLQHRRHNLNLVVISKPTGFQFVVDDASHLLRPICDFQREQSTKSIFVSIFFTFHFLPF